MTTKNEARRAEPITTSNDYERRAASDGYERRLLQVRSGDFERRATTTSDDFKRRLVRAESDNNEWLVTTTSKEGQGDFERQAETPMSGKQLLRATSGNFELRATTTSEDSCKRRATTTSGERQLNAETNKWRLVQATSYSYEQRAETPTSNGQLQGRLLRATSGDLERRATITSDDYKRRLVRVVESDNYNKQQMTTSRQRTMSKWRAVSDKLSGERRAESMCGESYKRRAISTNGERRLRAESCNDKQQTETTCVCSYEYSG
jgi:hypothetical protein